MLVLFKDLKSLIDVDEEDKLFLISPAINVEKGHVVVHLWQCPRMREVRRLVVTLMTWQEDCYQYTFTCLYSLTTPGY